MNRRTFSRQLLTGASAYLLWQGLLMSDALSHPMRKLTQDWLRELQEMSRDLKLGGITPLQWQQQLDCLYARVSLEEMLALTDLERLAKRFSFPERGVNTSPVHLPALLDLPSQWQFVPKIFGLKKDRAIIPHGHRNMASCHFVLKGDLHLRQYQKLAEDESHMLIDLCRDEIARPGSFASVSDDHQNIHWLKAESPTAFTFDVIVLDLNGQPYDIHNIDPFRARQEAKGLRVPKISVEEGLAKYGFTPHH